MAYIFMACIVMACIVMACISHGVVCCRLGRSGGRLLLCCLVDGCICQTPSADGKPDSVDMAHFKKRGEATQYIRAAIKLHVNLKTTGHN